MEAIYETTYKFNLTLTKKEVDILQEALHKAWSTRRQHEETMLLKAEDNPDEEASDLYYKHKAETDVVKNMRNVFANAVGVHYMGIDA